MNILITGAFRKENIDYSFFNKNGIDVFYLPDEKGTLPLKPDTIDFVICNGLFLHKKIESFSRLKMIQLTSAGFDRVPLNYIRKNNISIYNARGVYSVPMAEFAVFSVLNILKQADYFAKKQKEKSWEKHRNIIELNNMRVCIIGCGNVGTECAKRFLAFNCDVVGVDISQAKNSFFKSIYRINDLNEIVKTSDIVIFTLPLTKETFHLINFENILEFKKNSIIVNISRGAIIDTNCIINFHSHFKGIVMDVFEEEPLSAESSLWDLDNVYIYPHNSFVGNHNEERLREVIYENISSYLRVNN